MIEGAKTLPASDEEQNSSEQTYNPTKFVFADLAAHILATTILVNYK
jgi:hypothetical protein